MCRVVRACSLHVRTEGRGGGGGAVDLIGISISKCSV